MKNYILKYSSYANDIFNGDPIDIKAAYFAGIQFSLEINSCFIYFDVVTCDNKPIVLSFNLICESEDELDFAIDMYSDLFINGITAAANIPSLTAVSCFYKQTTKYDTYYKVYTLQTNIKDDRTIFKITMDRNIFYQIMFIFNKIRNFEEINCNGDNLILNKFNYFKPNIELIKLSNYNANIVSKQKLYCKKPRIFSKYFTTYCMINFTKSSSNTIVAFPIRLKNIYRKHKRKFILDLKDFETQMINTHLPAYIITDAFPVEFSLSADIPMTKYIFVGISVTDNSDYKYFNLTEEMFKSIAKQCIEFIKE